MMGITASIKIRVEDAKFSDLIAALNSSGWGFYENTIGYQHYSDLNGYGNWQTVDLTNLSNLLADLDQKSASGEYVIVVLYWQDDAKRIDLQWHTEEGITIFFDGTRPTLVGCESRFTDFTWVLEKVLCPIDTIGYNVLSVTCEDEY